MINVVFVPNLVCMRILSVYRTIIVLKNTFFDSRFLLRKGALGASISNLRCVDVQFLCETSCLF